MNLEDYFRAPSLSEVNESVERLNDNLRYGYSVNKKNHRNTNKERD